MSPTDPGMLGAAFYIRTLIVRPLLVTHALIFRLLRSVKGEKLMRNGSTPRRSQTVQSRFPCGTKNQFSIKTCVGRKS